MTLRRRPEKPVADPREPAPTWLARWVEKMALGFHCDPPCPCSHAKAERRARKLWASLPDDRRELWWSREP